MQYFLRIRGKAVNLGYMEDFRQILTIPDLHKHLVRVSLQSRRLDEILELWRKEIPEQRGKERDVTRNISHFTRIY